LIGGAAPRRTRRGVGPTSGSKTRGLHLARERGASRVRGYRHDRLAVYGRPRRCPALGQAPLTVCSRSGAKPAEHRYITVESSSSRKGKRVLGPRRGTTDRRWRVVKHHRIPLSRIVGEPTRTSTNHVEHRPVAGTFTYFAWLGGKPARSARRVAQPADDTEQFGLSQRSSRWPGELGERRIGEPFEETGHESRRAPVK